MKSTLKDYLTFTRKERIGALILVTLMGIFITAPYLYEPAAEMPEIPKEFTHLFTANDSISNAGTVQPAATPAGGRQTEPVLFVFDPNTIAEDGWLKLGISRKTTRTILNYRSKGGKFRSPADIRKIWGMDKENADRLMPYIQLAATDEVREKIKFGGLPAGTTPASPVKKQALPIDINLAGVEEWVSLPGIGEVLANRVVKFRDRIGGFISVEQVKKTYGISDSLFGMIEPYLRFNMASLPKLNLNTASAQDLRSRAGIPYSMAKAIIYFREQHGPYQSTDDIRKAFPIPDSLFQRISLLIKNE